MVVAMAESHQQRGVPSSQDVIDANLMGLKLKPLVLDCLELEGAISVTCTN